MGDTSQKITELQRQTDVVEAFQNTAIGNSDKAPNGTAGQAPQANRVIIEKANIDMPIYTGKDAGTLSKGGWIYPSTSTPDKNGNTVIFGHRFLYRPPIKKTFYNLDSVAIGDRIIVLWLGGRYTYEVDEVKTVMPTEVSVLNPTPTPHLTLITCTPLFSTKQRLVVSARLVQ